MPLSFWMGGCSDSVQNQADGSGDAAGDAVSEADGGLGSDASPDAILAVDGGGDASVDGDVACVPATVWHLGDDGFTSSDLGGFVAQPAPDAGCTEVGSVYVFSATAQTLSEHSCQITGPVDRTVQLTDAQQSQILTAAMALQTSCPPYSCGADFGTQSLTVHHSAPPSSTLYNGDFYAGCSGGQAPAGPYIAYPDLSDFETVLRNIVFPIRGDGGSP